jgi:hypothetical protein
MGQHGRAGVIALAQGSTIVSPQWQPEGSTVTMVRSWLLQWLAGRSLRVGPAHSPGHTVGPTVWGAMKVGDAGELST